jgi:hypothetical protein
MSLFDVVAACPEFWYFWGCFLYVFKLFFLNTYQQAINFSLYLPNNKIKMKSFLAKR